MVRQHYTAILLPFEDSYKKSLQGKVEQANRQGMNPGMQGRQGMPPQSMPNQMQRGMAGAAQGMGEPSANGPQGFPPMGQQPQRTSNGMGMVGSEGLIPGSHTPEPNLLDQDPQGIKRKLDLGELDSKRARPRTGGSRVAIECDLANLL
jgi:SWI/SNF chromatin-remodeling complex subunit SWI1